jgi:tetratricopeptide (TPR) repeat protein
VRVVRTATCESTCVAKAGNGKYIECSTMKIPAERIVRTGALLVALALCVVVAWRASTLGLAHYWAQQSPDRALSWRAAYPKALFAKAEASFRQPGATTLEVGSIRAGLRASPLEGRGFRYLGADAQARGKSQQALVLYTIAASRNPRDLASLAWLGDRALARGDFNEAIARMDRIMRVEPQREHLLAPVMLALAATPKAHAALVEALQARPPWRSRMLARILGSSPQVAPVVPLVESLRSTGQGLDPDELALWIGRLARDGRWGAAYLTWVQSLSVEASKHIGNVFNGGFESEPGPGGFDWRFDDIAGARISREQVTGAEGQVALRIEFDDVRVPFKHVNQLLALPPGKFELTGRARIDDLRSERGLVWTVTCAGSRRVLGESQAFSGRREWSGFSFVFEVPDAAECGGQRLTLRLPARIPAEQRIGGVAWFDGLRIRPR